MKHEDEFLAISKEIIDAALKSGWKELPPGLAKQLDQVKAAVEGHGRPDRQRLMADACERRSVARLAMMKPAKNGKMK